jgi:hypothetical protein
MTNLPCHERDGVARGEEVVLRSRPVSYLVPRIVPSLVVLGVAVNSFLTGSDLVGGPLLLVMALLMMSPWIYLFVVASTQPWAVGIGTDGVSWHRGRHVPWASIVEVRVRRQRKWSVPPSGVWLIDGPEADFAARARSRPMGYLIPTRYLRASPEDVVTAIARFATLPVIRK